MYYNIKYSIFNDQLSLIEDIQNKNKQLCSNADVAEKKKAIFRWANALLQNDTKTDPQTECYCSIGLLDFAESKQAVIVGMLTMYIQPFTRPACCNVFA